MIQQTDSELKKILQEVKTIAIVGASGSDSRDSYKVIQFLLEQGYNVIPINPAYKEILGRECYPELKLIKEAVDIVDIFRKSEDVIPIVQDAIVIKAKTVWMQLGVINDDAADLAQRSGLNVIMNRCIKIEYSRLMHG